MKRLPPLLTRGNGDLARDGIYTWTLPAWVTELDDGRVVNTCPSAGACAASCYARQGAYLWPAARVAHGRNLVLVLDYPREWELAMREETAHPRMRGAYVRIHDSGDFFSDDYLAAWLRIARWADPSTTFYAYTKEIERFRRLVEPDPPPNFRWIYSYGGRQDRAIRETDRRANVFTTEEELLAAGYSDQGDSDLLAIHGPPAVGIVLNRHPGAAARLGAESFAEAQASRHSPRVT